MPSIGSINQKSFKSVLDLLSEVSSETIGMFGVNWFIFSVIILFTSKSPLVTGVSSDLIFFLRPFFLNSIEIFPAYKKVSIRFSIISLILFFLSKRQI